MDCHLCQKPCERALNFCALGEETKRIFVSFDIRLETIPPGELAIICAACQAKILAEVVSKLTPDGSAAFLPLDDAPAARKPPIPSPS